MVAMLEDEDEKLARLLGGTVGMAPVDALPMQAPAVPQSTMAQLSALLGTGEDFQKPLKEASEARKRLDADFQARLAKARGNERDEGTITNAINSLGNIGKSTSDSIESFQTRPGQQMKPLSSLWNSGYNGQALAKQATADLGTQYGLQSKAIEADKDDALKAAEYGALAKKDTANAYLRDAENTTKLAAQKAQQEMAAAKLVEDRYQFNLQHGMKEADAKAQRAQEWAKLGLDKDRLKETSRHNMAMEAKPSGGVADDRLAYAQERDLEKDAKEFTLNKPMSEVRETLGMLADLRQDPLYADFSKTGMFGGGALARKNAPEMFGLNKIGLTPEQQAFQQKYRMTNAIERSKIFGASLTGSEKQSWDEATAQATSSDPATAKQGVENMYRIVERRYQNMKSGFKPEVVEKARSQGYQDPMTPTVPLPAVPDTKPSGDIETMKAALRRKRELKSGG